MIVPILNPFGLQVQILDAIAQAEGRGALAIADNEVPSIGLTRGVTHAVNDATKSASIGAMRMIFTGTVSVPSSLRIVEPIEPFAYRDAQLREIKFVNSFAALFRYPQQLRPLEDFQMTGGGWP